jgi:hypothetical protein
VLLQEENPRDGIIGNVIMQWKQGCGLKKKTINKYLTYKIPHGKTAACTCKCTSKNKDSHSAVLVFIMVLNCVQ